MDNKIFDLLVAPSCKGLAGMFEFNSDEYWGFILPDVPVRFYELIKQHRGSDEGRDAFPSLQVLADMLGKKTDEIINSYEFMTLLGFISYETAEEKGTASNHYKADNFLKSKVLMDVECVAHLIQVVMTTRKPYASQMDKVKNGEVVKGNFTKQLEIMEQYLVALQTGFWTDKDGQQEPIRQLTAIRNRFRAEDFALNRKTYNQMRQFVNAFYMCLAYSSKDKAIVDNYTNFSLVTFLSNVATPCDGGHTPSEGVGTPCDGVDTPCDGAEYNNNISPNKSLKTDDVEQQVAFKFEDHRKQETMIQEFEVDYPFVEFADAFTSHYDEEQGEYVEVSEFSVKQMSLLDLRKTVLGLCYYILDQDEFVLDSLIGLVNSAEHKKLMYSAVAFKRILENSIRVDNPVYICKQQIQKPDVAWVQNQIEAQQGAATRDFAKQNKTRKYA